MGNGCAIEDGTVAQFLFGGGDRDHGILFLRISGRGGWLGR